MIVTCHQPDLLPYSGFFYKMAKADVFDLKIWDQHVQSGYQRRVQMRGKWVTLPLVKGSPTAPITEKRVKPEAPDVLIEGISKAYNLNRKARALNWDKYGPMICDEIADIKTDRLWEFNLRLIMLVRDILGIETPISFSRPAKPGLRGAEGVSDMLQAYPTPLTYLSGTGARAYMGDCQPLTDAGIDVVWSRHAPVTGDSILTVLFDHEDPMSTVLAEHDDDDNKENVK